MHLYPRPKFLEKNIQKSADTYPEGSRSNANLTELGDVFAIHIVRYEVLCNVTAGNTFKKAVRDFIENMCCRLLGLSPHDAVFIRYWKPA